jgi:hypothetical protein
MLITYFFNVELPPTTLILPYGSNKQHCMDKEEYYKFCGVVQGWFSAKLGLKISDGPQH